MFLKIRDLVVYSGSTAQTTRRADRPTRFYGCSPDAEERAQEVFAAFDGLVGGGPWFNGDHMLFVQASVRPIAFNSVLAPELLATVTYTPLDRHESVEGRKLVQVAHALDAPVRSLSHR
jgi:hypothetical protein